MRDDCRLKVLVMDDNEINGIILSNMLTMYHFDVEQCESGKAGLELLRRHHYDIILVDFIMQDMNGFEVIQAIRNMPISDEKSLIYILTSTSYGDILDQCLQLGANGVFEKPLQMFQLNLELQKHNFGVFTSKHEDPLPQATNTIWSYLENEFDHESEMNLSVWRKYTFGKQEICMDLIQATLKEIQVFFEDIRYKNSINIDEILCKHLHSLKSLFSYIGANHLYSIVRKLEDSKYHSDDSECFLLFLRLLHKLKIKLTTAVQQYQADCGTERFSERKEKNRNEWENIKRREVIESLQNYDYYSIIESLNELIKECYHEKYVLALEKVKEFSYEKALDVMNTLEETALFLGRGEAQ